MVSQRGIEANLHKINVILEMEAPQVVKDIQRLTERIAAFNRFVSKAIDKYLPFFRVLCTTPQFKWTLECEQAFVQLKEHLRQAPLLLKP